MEAWETDIPSLPHVTDFQGDLHSNTVDVFAALSSLRVLELVVSDLSTAQARAALSAWTGLTTLSAPDAGLTDTGPLAPLSLLTDVDLDSNQIQDISSLSALANVRSLDRAAIRSRTCLPWSPTSPSATGPASRSRATRSTAWRRRKTSRR